MNEWYFHKFLEYNNLIFLKYFFIQPVLNNKKFPIYVVEEVFDSNLLKRNNKNDGIIFKLISNSKDKFIKYQKNTLKKRFFKDRDYLENQIKLFYKGKIPAKNIFDVVSFAKVFAISEIWGYKHAIFDSQIRFYFNPVTKLIEPILYDMSLFYHLDKYGTLTSKNFIENYPNRKTYIHFLLNDEQFLNELKNQINLIANKDFLEKFFKMYELEAKENISRINKSFWYHEVIHLSDDKNSPKYLPYDKNIIFENCKIALDSYQKL